MSTFTPILHIEEVAPNQDQKEGTINTAVAILEAAMNDALSVAMGGNVTLDQDQFTRYFFFQCTGNAVPRTLFVPATPRWFAVENGGTASITVDATGAGGLTVEIPAGKIALLISDGHDVRVVVPNGAMGLLGDLSDVNTTGAVAGTYLGYDAGSNMWIPKTVAPSAFTALSDVPHSYAGANSKIVAVNSAGTGLEFVISGAGINSFIDLDDTPTSYIASDAGKTLKVNGAHDGVIFSTPLLTEAGDFPSTYSGHGNQLVVVKPDGTGLDFRTGRVSDLGDGPGAPSAPNIGKFVRVNAAGDAWEYASGTSGRDYFTELLDTPDSYAGQSLKIVRVNNASDGLEFGAGFLNLSDTPANYTAASNLLVSVNGAGNGLVFRQPKVADLSDGPGQPLLSHAKKVVRVNTAGDALEYHIQALTDLAGFPASYTGMGGRFVKVKGDETGLQFVQSNYTTNFLALTDTLDSYEGQAGRLVKVDGALGGDGTGLIFVDPPFIPSRLGQLADVEDATLLLDGDVLTWRNGVWQGEAAGGGADGGTAGLVAVTSIGKHSRYRLLFKSVQAGGTFVAIREINMRTNSQGPELADGGAAFASTQQTLAQASNAFDGGPSAWFSDDNDINGAYIGYAFSSPVEIGYLEVVASTTTAGAPKNFDFQYSDDGGTTWVTIYRVRDLAVWTAGETRNFITPGAIPQFSKLIDVPDGYSGQGLKYVRVRADATGLEYQPFPFIPRRLEQLDNVDHYTDEPTQGSLLAYFDGAWTHRSAADILARDFGAHTHWRLRVISNGYSDIGPSKAILAELEFLATYDGVDQAVGGTATASSTDGASSPANAFDDNVATDWISGVEDFATGGPWLAYEFPEAVHVGSVVMTTPADNLDNNLYAPQDCAIEYSDDGVVWEGAWRFLATTDEATTTRFDAPTAVNNFTDLFDVPQGYVLQGGKTLYVRDDETGLEFRPATDSIATLHDVDYGTGIHEGDVLTYKDGVWQPESPLDTSGGVNNGAAHLHWRVLYRLTNGSSSAALAEVAIRSVPGGPTLTVGGTPTGTSATGGTAASDAFDGNITTRWMSSAGNAAWIAYQFSTPVSVAQVGLTPYASALTGAPVNFDIQYSNNGSTWVTILAVDGHTSWTALTEENFTVPTGYDFTDLLDTPDTYAGQGLKYARVKANETGLEFQTFPFIPVKLGQLSDVEDGTGNPNEGDILAWHNGVWQAEEFPDLNPNSMVYIIEPGSFAPPTAGSFPTTINPDAATISQTFVDGKGLILNFGVGSGTSTSRIVRAYTKPAPSDPSWTLTTRLRATLRGVDQETAGLVVQASTNALVTFGRGWNATTDVPTIAVAYYSSYTNRSSVVAEFPATPDLDWFRIVYTGTNLVFYVSADGETWAQVANASATANLVGAPSQVGFYADVASTSALGALGLQILYYEDTAYPARVAQIFKQVTQLIVEPGGFAPPHATDFNVYDPTATGSTFHDETVGTVFNAKAATNGVQAIRGAFRTAPAGVWESKSRLRPSLPGQAGSAAGIAIRNVTSGRMITLGIKAGATAPTIALTRQTNASTVSAVMYEEPWVASVDWFKVASDGTTLTFSISSNGVQWYVVHTELLATFMLAVDLVGFYVDPQGLSTGADNGLLVLYYEDTTYPPNIPDPTGGDGEETLLALSDLTDVNLTVAPTNKQVLTYDTASASWLSKDPQGLALPVSTQNNHYTLAIEDANSVLRVSASTLRTVTIPTNAVVPFPIGTQVTITQAGAGTTSVAGASGVTLEFPSDMLSTTRKQFSTVTIVKVALNVWTLMGDLTLVT